MRQFIRLFCFIGILLLISCARQHVNPLDGKDRVKLERRKTSELIAVLDSLSALRPKYFYSKIKCSFKDTNQSVSFKASIRMVRDSAVNALITFASIPIVNALIRPDSVIVVNKREKCVVRQNVSFIKEQFGVDFDYKNIEELFLGLPVGFDTTQKYFQLHDPYNYILSSHKKRAIRREQKGKPERFLRREDKQQDDNNVILNYYLSDDAKGIKRIFIDSPDDSTTINVDYLSRDSVSNYLIPNDVMIEIVTPRNHMVVELGYDKSEADTPQEIHFVIPEGYEECTDEKQ